MPDVFWNESTPNVPPGPNTYVPVRIQGAAADGSQDTFAQMLFDAGSLGGASAYQIWLAAGNTGSIGDFLASLKGSPGVGMPGPSAYQLWISAGNTGTVQDFLASLVGTPSNALAYPAGDTAVPLPNAVSRAGKLVGFDPSGTLQMVQLPAAPLISFQNPGENDIGLWVQRAAQAGLRHVALPYNASGYEWHTPVNFGGNTVIVELGGNLIRIVPTIIAMQGFGESSRVSDAIFIGSGAAGQVAIQLDAAVPVFSNIAGLGLDKCFHQTGGFEPKLINVYGRNCVTCFAHFENGVGPIIEGMTYDTDGPWYGGSTPQPTKGAIWLQTQGAAFSNVDAIHSGLTIEAVQGTNIEWGLFSQCWFDSSATSAGVEIINNTASSYIRGLFFDQVWAATCQFGYRISGTCAPAQIDGIFLSNCPIHNNGYEGIRVNNGINIAVDDCTLFGNNADGTASYYGYTKTYVASQVKVIGAISNFTMNGGRIGSAGLRWSTTPFTQVDVDAGVSGSMSGVALSGATVYGKQTRNASTTFAEQGTPCAGMLGISSSSSLTYDDGPALQALLQQLANGNGGILPGLPGGGIQLIDQSRTYYINSVVNIPARVTLKGHYRRGELLGHDSQGNNDDKNNFTLGSLPGTIILGPNGILNLNDGSGLVDLPVISAAVAAFQSVAGQALPVSAVDTLLAAYANYPQAVSTSNGACDMFLENTFIVGFALGAKFVYNERWQLTNTKWDCLNCVYSSQTYDYPRIDNIHCWPFGWAHRFSPGTTGTSEPLTHYGTAIKFDTGADTSRSTDGGHVRGVLTYGYSIGLDLVATNGLIVDGAWIDNDNTRSDAANTIGIRTSFNCRRSKLTNVHCDSNGRNFDMQATGWVQLDQATATGAVTSQIRWGASATLQIGSLLMQDVAPLYVEIVQGVGQVTCSNLVFSIPNGVALGYQNGSLPNATDRANIRLGQVTVENPGSSWSYDQTQWNHL